MGVVRNLLFGRSRTFGLLSDIAMVAGAAVRVARRPSGEAGRRGGPADLAQWVLVAGAAFRILRRVRKVRRNRRLAAADG